MATTASMPPYMLPGVPVHQPAHLEGDPALATEILPGPPSLVSAQQSAQKRDPKKLTLPYSYLPPSDPGSTYSGIMHGTLIGHEEPHSKRSRSDKGATGRAQRASARNQSAMTLAVEPMSSTESASGSGAQPIVMDAEPSGSATGDEEPTLSRSNSSPNLQDAATQPSVSRGGKKDKGKGKEVDALSARVKEDAKATGLPTLEPSSHSHKNDETCSACRSYGALVYCDGCVRAFHLWCLDPPLESIDESDSSRWFCPACVLKKNPPRKPPPSLLSPLIHQIETSIPVEYQLPEEIRTYFRDVNTGPRGQYVDAAAEPSHRRKLGVLEDRDPHRLRDKNGKAVLCFKCGVSALPSGLASTMPAAKRPRRAASKSSTPDEWKSIVSCDYCDLHWHLDCLDPPLPSMPPITKKWMCPNHAERLLPPKRRIPKNNATPIEVTKPRQWNNGNIEIVQSEPPAAVMKPRVHVEEVLINGRRYRVPERIVILDFWGKLNRLEPEQSREVDMASGLSSPLTSLSSLDDNDDRMDTDSPADTLQAAQLLVNFASKVKLPGSAKSAPTEPRVQPTNSAVNGTAKSSSTVITIKTPSPKKVSTSKNVQPISSAPIPTRPSRTAKKAATIKISNAIDLRALDSASHSVDVSGAEEPARPKRAYKRKVDKQGPALSTRELRSRSRNATQDSISSITFETQSGPSSRLADDGQQTGSSVSTPASTTGGKTKFRPVVVKHEEEETQLSFSVSAADPVASTTATQAAPRRRQSRRSLKAPEEASKAEEKETKGKRGKKRKEREDEVVEESEPSQVPTPTTTSGKRSRKEKADKGEVAAGPKERKKKAINPPASASGNGEKTPESKESASARIVLAASTPRLPPPATPSLKIRLPRIGSAVKPANPIGNGNTDSPSRL